MKKLLIIFVISLIYYSININNDNMLRIRVIANSNTKYDQDIKNNISNDLRKELYELLKDEKDIKNARNIVKNNISNLKNIIDKNLIDANYSYTINYGLNYFPKKEYNGKTYDSGKYESLLITLGEGKGNNWWCILFPPICLLEAEESENVEYSFFLFDFVKKIFN